VAILVEVHQRLRTGDTKEQRGADDQQPDAHEAGAERDHEPVGDVGDDLALLPPQLAGIAGGAAGQKGEDDAERDRDRQNLEHGLAGDLEHTEQFEQHRFDLPRRFCPQVVSFCRG
jgi:hypothetical protein